MKNLIKMQVMARPIVEASISDLEFSDLKSASSSETAALAGML